MNKVLKNYNDMSKQNKKSFEAHRRKILKFLQNERLTLNRRLTSFNRMFKLMHSLNNDLEEFNIEDDCSATYVELEVMLQEILDLYPKFMEKINAVETNIKLNQTSVNFITNHLISCKGMCLYNEYQTAKLELQRKEIAFEDKFAELRDTFNRMSVSEEENVNG